MIKKWVNIQEIIGQKIANMGRGQGVVRLQFSED